MLCILHAVCTTYGYDACFKGMHMVCMLNAASCMHNLQM